MDTAFLALDKEVEGESYVYCQQVMYNEGIFHSSN